MNVASSRMLAEALAAPAAVAAQAREAGEAYRDVARELRARLPTFGLTIARGSSDHAAAYAAALMAEQLGLVTASLPPSTVTLRDAPLRCQESVALAISQSGASPDLVATLAGVQTRGAVGVAMVNDVDSPLAAAAAHVLPLAAGEEHSVAATKSFIASLAGAARLVAAWAGDAALTNALDALPDALSAAAAQDWSAAVAPLKEAEAVLVVGRGAALPVAQEAALKLIETCALPAMAFSAAEIRHGPLALVGEGTPVIVFAPPGPTQADALAVAADLAELGARVLIAAPPDVAGAALPLPAAPHPALAPIVAIQAFYPFVARLAVARGRDPDHPPNLNKVTRTY